MCSLLFQRVELNLMGLSCTGEISVLYQETLLIGKHSSTINKLPREVFAGGVQADGQHPPFGDTIGRIFFLQAEFGFDGLGGPFQHYR